MLWFTLELVLQENSLYPMKRKKIISSPGPLSDDNTSKTEEIRQLIRRKKAENNVLKKIIEQKIKPTKSKKEV